MQKLQKLAKSTGKKAGEKVAAVALASGVQSVNSACVVLFHQPKVPKGMDQFKKR